MKYLSICAIVRNESFYVEEWIEWHLLQGVEHFYIYHNTISGEDDKTAEILFKYAELGILTYIEWPYFPGQFSAYVDCLEKYQDDSEWIAFLDCDEFLCKIGFLNLPLFEYSATFLPLNHFFVGIAIHWQLFGSNGHVEKTNDLVIERFPYRQDGVNDHVKTIVRPKYVEFSNKNAHTFYPKKDYIIIDENFSILPKNYATIPGTATNFVIRHYHTKSFEEYMLRKSVGSPDFAKPYEVERIKEMFPVHDRNEFYDPIPTKLIDKVKNNIASRPWKK